MTDHLGYASGSREGRGAGNNRNGKSTKTIIGDSGPIETEAPGTETQASSRVWSRSASGGWKGLTRRSWPFFWSGSNTPKLGDGKL